MIRSKVVAIVSSLSAMSGAIAGGVSMLVAAAVLTPTEPVTAGQIAAMVVENAAVFGVTGAVVGTLASFGFLRRVPLGKLIVWTNLGTTAGLLAGWLGGPWAWHHFELMGLTGFAAGAMLARVVSSATTDASPTFSPSCDSPDTLSHSAPLSSLSAGSSDMHEAHATRPRQRLDA